MEHNPIEKNIQDKLQGYENFVGDKMDLWQGINEKLEKKKKRRFLWFFWGGFSGLFIGLITLFLWKGSPTTTQSRQSGQLANTTLNKPSSTTNSSAELAQPDPNTQHTKQPVANAKIVDNLKSTSTKKAEPILTPDKPLGKMISLIEKRKTTNSQINNVNPVDHNSPKQYTPNTVNNIQPTSVGDNTLEDDDAAHIHSFQSSDPLELAHLTPMLFEPNKPHPIEVIDTIYRVPIYPIEKWRISAAAGIVRHQSGYDAESDYLDLLENSETNQTGWQLTFDVERALRMGFSVATGINYSRYWTQFNARSETTGTNVLENVILAYYINTRHFDNDTLISIGDTSVSTLTERIVVHHNRFDKLQIPLMMGKRINKGKWSVAGFAGIGLDWWLHRSGKHYDQKFELAEFNQSTDEGFSKLGFSLMLRGSVDFSLTAKTGIFIQPNGSLSLSDWSAADDGLKQKPFSYGLNVGWWFNL